MSSYGAGDSLVISRWSSCLWPEWHFLLTWIMLFPCWKSFFLGLPISLGINPRILHPPAKPWWPDLKFFSNSLLLCPPSAQASSHTTLLLFGGGDRRPALPWGLCTVGSLGLGVSPSLPECAGSSISFKVLSEPCLSAGRSLSLPPHLKYYSVFLYVAFRHCLHLTLYYVTLCISLFTVVLMLHH